MATTSYKREIHPGTGVFGARWLIDAPWAHPHWSQYIIFLYDLTTPTDDGNEPTILVAGHTHEFLLYALDPREGRVPMDANLHETSFAILHPANYGYQFKAESNEAAVERIQELVDAIVDTRLSPDTDFRSLWNKLLPDMYPLVKSIFEA